MRRVKALVCGVTLFVALAPLAAFAADTSVDHAQAELANGDAQWNLAVQQSADMQAQAQIQASNERMIALLKSEAMRQRQLSLVSNANAMEAIAAALANTARTNGDFNAQNELIIAQTHAAVLLAKVDANLANAQMLALMKGRTDELENARAQSNLLHQVADFIAGQQAELKMANAKEIGQEQADAIHTPAIAQQQNGVAMGANQLLAADTALMAGDLAATSVTIHEATLSSQLLAHAAASKANAHAQAAAAGVK